MVPSITMFLFHRCTFLLGSISPAVWLPQQPLCELFTNAKEVLLIATSTTIPGRILLAVPTFGIREVLLTIWSVWHPHHAVLGGC